MPATRTRKPIKVTNTAGNEISLNFLCFGDGKVCEKQLSGFMYDEAKKKFYPKKADKSVKEAA